MLEKLNEFLIQNPVIFDEQGSEIARKTESLLDDVYTDMKVIATPLAAIAFAYCAYKLFRADNPQAVQQAKTYMIVIAVGIAILYLAPTIVTTISNIAG